MVWVGFWPGSFDTPVTHETSRGARSGGLMGSALGEVHLHTHDPQDAGTELAFDLQCTEVQNALPDGIVSRRTEQEASLVKLCSD